MSCKEQQQEEREVMQSIYDGDACFKEIDHQRYQYKIEGDTSKSFLVEIAWDDEYPNSIPTFNLETFYNKHLCKEVKEAISKGLTEQAAGLLGSAMTYTLIEWVKENAAALMEDQPEKTAASDVLSTGSAETALSAASEADTTKRKDNKKDQLSKNQKRRMYDKFGTKGMMEDKPRGWDWVDIVKHLSQTGGAQCS